MQLRPATHDDVVALVGVQRAGSLVTLADVFAQAAHPFPRTEIEGRWHSEIDDLGLGTYVAVRNGVVVGFAATSGAELLHFGIGPDDFGTGLAGWLHTEVLSLIVGAGHPRAVVRVFEGNARARAFYERLGWVPTGVRSRSAFEPYPVLLEYVQELGSEGTVGPPGPEVVELAHQLLDLARDGAIERLLAYVDAGVPCDLTDAQGNTLLMLAAYHGHADVVRALAARGADIDALNDRGQSPLAGAVFKGEDNVVSVLLDAGADPDVGSPSARATAEFFGRTLPSRR